MLKDCLEIFEKAYIEKGDSYIIDNYQLGEGSYVLIGEDHAVEKIFEVGKKNVDTTDSYYYIFAEMDYLSRLVDMNKPIDSKKAIHSNNYLSFFIKKENVNPQKLTEEIINNYYNILAAPLAKYKKQSAKMYQDLEDKYGKSDSNRIERNKNWIKENIYSLLKEVKNDKNYLKIFFKADIEEYIKESEKYVIPNIYNNSDYNTKIDGITFGLPNDNMGLNSKKPYLENKTRKNTLPYLISDKEVMLQKKFFDYLMNYVAQGRTNAYINEDDIKCLTNEETIDDEFSGYFLKLKKGKEVEIHDFDIVAGMKNKIEGLSINQVIPIDYEKLKGIPQYIGDIESISKLKVVVSEVYFNKFLTTNYFTEPKDIKLNDFRVKENLLKCRNAFFNWFYKGDLTAIKPIIDNVTMELIKNSIANGYMIKAKEQYNVRCGLLKYLRRKEDMADILGGIVAVLRKKINSDTTDKIDTDSEYYFAVGQLASYLLSLNRSNKKMHSLINPVLNCKTDEKLMAEIRKLFRKYNYAINKGSKRFNNLNTMILGYVPENSKIQEDILVAGYLYSSLIYESKED